MTLVPQSLMVDFPSVRTMVGICPEPRPINPLAALTLPRRHETSPAHVVCHGSETFLMRSRNRTRTYNLPVNSRLLCQLSYAGSFLRVGLARLVRFRSGGA